MQADATHPLVKDASPEGAEVSLFRLYLLRAAYLLLVVGLGLTIWPGLVAHASAWPLMTGVTNCMLATVALLALVGLRYPLRMLPLLFFEIIWKSIWLIAVALPLYQAHRIDADTQDTINACLIAIVFPIVMPWGFVYRRYVAAPGDRWR